MVKKKQPIDEAEDLWLGNCICGQSWSIPDATLADEYPDLAEDLNEGAFSGQCPTCGSQVELVRQHVAAVPFSAWNVLPPTNGCQECGREHDPGMPHDLQSLLYQYNFRNGEAKAGREERWPTWHDAMRHCTPETRTSWITALAEHGVDVTPEDK